MADVPSPRVGVLVVAYNAASTLASVLDRIPEGYRESIDHVMVADDASTDSTFLIGVGYRETFGHLPITVVRHDENRGYGGNQKWGYRWAMEHGLDVVVLLHGDGQYAPELLPEMVAPILEGDADAVMGSRMLPPGSARAGGMPLYKWVGNRILTTVQNRLTGASLSEWHSGYRAYRVDALRDLDLDSMSDGFDFDTQILLGLMGAGRSIVEIPIPTYYGDEISYVNGMRYARQVTGHVLRHRLRRIGFGAGARGVGYEAKVGAGTSHQLLLDRLARRPTGRVLDLGCADGHLGGALRDEGHEVVGVDGEPSPEAAQRLDRHIVADLDAGLPPEVTGDFDVVLVADVLEHLRDPGALLEEVEARLRPGGRVVGSIPNFAHWYPRARVVTGLFDYDARGILDRGHLRFYTRRSFRRLCESAGYRVVDLDAAGLPVEVFQRGGAGVAGPVLSAIGAVDRVLARLRPTLFAFQFLFELEAADQPSADRANRSQSAPSDEATSLVAEGA